MSSAPHPCSAVLEKDDAIGLMYDATSWEDLPLLAQSPAGKEVCNYQI